MKISVLTPAGKVTRTGKRTIAVRPVPILRGLGRRAPITTGSADEPAHLMIAMHA